MSWKRLQDTFARGLEDFLKTSSKRPEGILKMCWTRFLIPLEDVSKKPWSCLGKTSWRRLEDAFARRLNDVLKTSWRCAEDV